MMKCNYFWTLVVAAGFFVEAPSLARGALLLSAESAGYYDGFYARLKVNGVEKGNNAPGINFTVLDETNGAFLDSTYFTIWNDVVNHNSLQRDAMVNYVNSIATGRIVMLAVEDDGWYAWNSNGDLGRLSSSLQSLGASSVNMTDVGFRGSYALIGAKGGAVGSAVEAKRPQHGGPVAVSSLLNVGDPLASFALLPSANGQTIAFDASSSSHTNHNSSLVSYEWDFGDGATASGINGNHTFTTPGLYDITLTVTDVAGQRSTLAQQYEMSSVPEPTTLAIWSDAEKGISPISDDKKVRAGAVNIGLIPFLIPESQRCQAPTLRSSDNLLRLNVCAPEGSLVKSITRRRRL